MSVCLCADYNKLGILNVLSESGHTQCMAARADEGERDVPRGTISVLSAEIDEQDVDVGRGDAWDTRCLADRLGADAGQLLACFHR